MWRTRLGKAAGYSLNTSRARLVIVMAKGSDMSSTDKTVARYRLKKLIEELKRKRGRGTELITLYIPPGKRMSEVIGYLRQEYSTASNIKSDLTRKHVQEALVKVMERLKYFDEAPENGLVVFCGAVPQDGPGTEKMEIYVVVPPEPLNVNLYRCDDHFHTEYLEKTLQEKEVYGLISIDVNQAAIGLLEGDAIKVLSEHTSGIPGKHRAGGQSARRFERLREMAVHQYFDRVARHVNEEFLREEVFSRLKGIIVGGPGPTKHDFVKEADLDYRLRKMILAIVDTNYAGEEGLREIVSKASNVLENVRYVYEKKLVDRFMSYVARSPSMVLYGLKPVLDNLYSGAIETLLITEDFDYHQVTFACENCGHEFTKVLRRAEVGEIEGRRCEKCGSGFYRRKEDKSILDIVADLAEMSMFKLAIISPKTEHGVIFKRMGGIGAILKYPLSY